MASTLGISKNALPGFGLSVRADVVHDSRTRPGSHGAAQRRRVEIGADENYYVILSASWSGWGFGVIFKRNLITIFMSIELMRNAVQSWRSWRSERRWANSDGQVFVVCVIVVAAAEAARGTAEYLIARNRKTLTSTREPAQISNDDTSDARIPWNPMLTLWCRLVNGTLRREVAE